MLKRTKGRILLAMLVITGLAGTINDSTLSNQERKFAITQLKDTRTDLLVSIKDLSERQFNYKPLAEKWSINEYLYHIALTERELWYKLEAAMKEPATRERRLELKISDEEVLKTVTDRTTKDLVMDSLQPKQAGLQSASEALSIFKISRAQHIKYVKNSTGDLRNHFIQLPIGWVDCYQSIIFMSAHSNRYIQQIYEILADPGFPKN